MNEAFDAFLKQTPVFQLAMILCIALACESAARMRQLRWAYSAVVFLTIGLWYFLDPLYRPGAYATFTDAEFDLAYAQVCIFLVSFRLLIEAFLPRTLSRSLSGFDPRQLSTGNVVSVILAVWLVLFCIGMYRANFRFVDTLLPLQSRASWGKAEMWARPRFGGAFTFLISAAGYTYLLICSVFGVIAVATTSAGQRFLMLCLMTLTWPMFMLSGTRSNLLAVVVPTIISVLVMKRWSRSKQVLFIIVCAAVINAAMLATIASRNVGFDKYFAQEDAIDQLTEKEHEGLNMPEELMYINHYQEFGVLEPEWGYEYFAQAVNFVPRGIWPGKPFPGEKFSGLRAGFLRNGEIAATISNGLIGQGVQNFGTWLGPVAPSVLLACFGYWICVLPCSGELFLRCSLAIFAIALIPNLGRDITLFTLWPLVFGAMAVNFYETSNGIKGRSPRGMTSLSSNHEKADGA